MVIDWYVNGKTYREISKLHISFRDIKKIIAAYEKKVRLQSKKEENNQQPTTKRLSPSSRAFLLYQEGKKISDVKILLDIPYKQAMNYWRQYLKSIRMFESFEFYQEHSYDIPAFLSINNFIKRNSVHIKDIANILMETKTTVDLQLRLSTLKNDIERLQKTKNNYLLNQNSMNNHHQLPPLGPLPRYYNW